MRWTTAGPVLFWSAACPAFFGLGVAGYVAPVVLGGVVAGRLMVMRNLASDKTTWKLWALWLVVLYSLPVAEGCGAWLWGLKEILGGFSLWSDMSEPLSLVGVSSMVMFVESKRLSSYGLRVPSLGTIL